MNPDIARKWTLDELDARRAGAPRQPLPVVVFLENVRSLHNVGSIFRTADGAGARKIVLAGGTGTPPRKEIAKVALGAEEAVPWEYYRDPLEAAHALRAGGYPLLAVEQTRGAGPLYEAALPFPCCLVFGHEVDGISEALLEQCDAAIEVPMFGAKHSLNVSVCAGVVLFEARRRYENSVKSK